MKRGHIVVDKYNKNASFGSSLFAIDFKFNINFAPNGKTLDFYLFFQQFGS